LHPLEKYTCLEHCLTKIICNFEILLLLAAGALCSCRAHTYNIAKSGKVPIWSGFSPFQLHLGLIMNHTHSASCYIAIRYAPFKPHRQF